MASSDILPHHAFSRFFERIFVVIIRLSTGQKRERRQADGAHTGPPRSEHETPLLAMPASSRCSTARQNQSITPRIGGIVKRRAGRKGYAIEDAHLINKTLSSSVFGLTNLATGNSGRPQGGRCYSRWRLGEEARPWQCRKTYDVTIAIPTRTDAGPSFKRTLEAVRGQDTARSVEVLAADSHSSDGTLELLSAHGARVLQVPRAPFRLGPCSGNAVSRGARPLLW